MKIEGLKIWEKDRERIIISGPGLLGKICNAGFLVYALSYKPASSSAGPCYVPSL